MSITHAPQEQKRFQDKLTKMLEIFKSPHSDASLTYFEVFAKDSHRESTVKNKFSYVVVQNSVKFDKSFRSMMEYAAMQRKYNKN